MIICTQEGITKSQPTICVSYSYPLYDNQGNDIGGARLSAHRTYPLPNQWGGTGRSKPLDGDGKIFPSWQEAKQWAMEHGYIRTWRRTYDPKRKAERVARYALAHHLTQPHLVGV